jgi:hypothetical protein
MRKELLAMASATALGFGIGLTPAGALQIAPSVGSSDSNIIKVQREGRGGGGGSFNAGGGGDSGGRGGVSGNFSSRGGSDMGGRGGANLSAHGNARGDGARGSANFQAQGEGRGNVQFNRRAGGPHASFGDKGDRRGPSNEAMRRDSDNKGRRGGDKGDWKWSDKKDWGDKLKHRGRSKHGHVFFGGFLVGVPFGYAAVTGHPCYDWTFGPNGWGYYWNYYRCPV